MEIESPHWSMKIESPHWSMEIESPTSHWSMEIESPHWSNIELEIYYSSTNQRLL